MLNKITPTVSIIMITYNHENFITDAINGILMQEYSGKIELIIANDNSLDNTDTVIKKLLNYQFSNQRFEIKYTNHSQNKGMMPNFKWALQQVQGKYIALCEGDDYWTDPLKLQKQVDFLEANEDYNLVYHKIQIYDDEQKTFTPETLNTSNEFKTITLEDLALRGNLMHTPSVVYRNNITYNSKLFSLPIGDYVLWCLNAEKGAIGYFPDTMAIYRISEKSIWSKKSHFYRIENWLKALVALYHYFKSSEIKYAYSRQAWTLVRDLKNHGITFKETVCLIILLCKMNIAFIKKAKILLSSKTIKH